LVAVGVGGRSVRVWVGIAVGVFVSVGPTGLGKGVTVAVPALVLVTLGGGVVGEAVFVAVVVAVSVLAGRAVGAGATVTTSGGTSSGPVGLSGLKKTSGLTKIIAMASATSTVKPTTRADRRLYSPAEPFFMSLAPCALPAKRPPWPAATG
jgi:hypothetical protein